MTRSEDHDRRIDYVEIPVLDIATAKSFYGDAFGWSFQDWGDTYASFNDGRLDGGFSQVDAITPGGLLVILYANDLEAMEKRIPECGGAIVKEIFSFPGGRRFHFTDPFGHELAVWSDK